MNDRSQRAFRPIKRTKNQRSQKKDLRFAETRVDKVTRQLVNQTAVVGEHRVNCFAKESDNAFLARIYDRRRRAMDHLLRIQAFR